MDKNNFNKFINKFEIHCDKLFPMRDDPFKVHEDIVDVKMLNKQKEKIVELNESFSKAELATSKDKVNNKDEIKNLKNQKSIIKERQEMIVKNKDFLLALFKKFVETQDQDDDIEF